MRTSVAHPAVCFILGVTLACNLSTREAPAKPPVSRIEVIGGQARVELVEGVSARTIVGADIFGDFLPGWTPEEAEKRFGKPKEVQDTEYLTLFVYERQGKRVAIARQTVLQSGGGAPGASFDLRAYPPDGYLETLPEPVRNLIRSEPSVREIHVRSGVQNDWRIRLICRDGKISHVSAAPPLDERS